ncbi:hypothetical protein G2W53_018964 [Senna tora]|uniref:Uncharacterized protein n=1 Tax=Senna tora TaxID=362788 RepID=A0A834TWT7_9FABA|nr:hypothetical protein G2W53_018964 [Senna tora]
MAIDVRSDTPRISFSHDLKKNTNDVASSPIEDHSGSSGGSDFVFCIANRFSQKLSSADELFSNGKLVPTNLLLESSPRRSQPPSSCSEKKRLKEFLSEDTEDEEEEEEEEEEEQGRVSFKSFWQFKRSSSLNCDTTTRGKSLIRSLQFLSRSNSTGSALNPKHTEIQKEIQRKQKLQKQSSVSSRRSLSSSSSSTSSSSTTTSTYYFYSSSQKGSLKIRNGGSYGNGVRISPVLNLPQAYIPKATSKLHFDS